jgi:hypothetical protein
LQYAIQFVLIDIFQNVLETFKKLVFASHVNPFKFFFHSRKQAEAIGAKSGESSGWLWHAGHVIFCEPVD